MMIGSWLLWGIGVVALVVPSTLGLTVMRMVSALAWGGAVVGWIAGASPVPGAVFGACALLGGALVGGAAFVKRCMQAAADGAEAR